MLNDRDREDADVVGEGGLSLCSGPARRENHDAEKDADSSFLPTRVVR